MKKLTAALPGVVALAAVSATAFAQSYAPPQVQSIGPTDIVKIVPQGNPAAGDQYAPAPLVGNYGATLPGNNPENLLIGGDATTNLFQRATTGSSVTTTVTYGGPDRWAYWSGTSTAMTLSRSSTAADLPAAYQYGFKMARTSGQTGVVQVCMLQEIEGGIAYRLQGQTAELDFHAATGANFSAASANMTAYVITGTGADEGVAGSASVAFGLNAGGGGSGGWTGQANNPVVVNLGAVSTLNRYGVAVPIPAGTTEIAVALCYKPVGTAGTNDYVTFSGIQLVPNNALTAAAGTAGIALAANDPRAKSFARRPPTTEALLQYRYFYKLAEGAAIQTRGLCHDIDVTHADCLVNFPVPMRIAPVFSGDGGFTAGFAVPTTTAGTTLGNCSALALSANVTSTVASTNNALITCTATTVPAAGTVDILYDNNGSGVIKASSEL